MIKKMLGFKNSKIYKLRTNFTDVLKTFKYLFKRILTLTH